MRFFQKYSVLTVAKKKLISYLCNDSMNREKRTYIFIRIHGLLQEIQQKDTGEAPVCNIDTRNGYTCAF